MYFSYLMLIGPLISITLLLILILMVREPKVSEDKMLLLHTLFLEATGSPPTDAEYVIFSKLSRKEMRKVFKKLKK